MICKECGQPGSFEIHRRTCRKCHSAKQMSYKERKGRVIQKERAAPEIDKGIYSDWQSRKLI